MIRCFGTVYRLHPLFIVMMALSAWMGYFLELLTLFGIVIVHELGHAAAARRFGWHIVEIRLFPFGGVMEVNEPDSVTSGQEIIVALAGPLQNVIMIGLAYVLQALGLWDAGWADYFIRANMIIALFNLAPILPLDGGRIVHALLCKRYAYYETLVAGAWLSMLLSAMLLPLSLYRYTERGLNLNVLLLSLFLLFSNWYAYKNVYYRFIRFLLGRDTQSEQLARRGCYGVPIVVAEPYDASATAKLLIRGQYHLIYVMDTKGNVQSVHSERRLIRRFFSEHRIAGSAGHPGAGEPQQEKEPDRADISSMIQ